MKHLEYAQAVLAAFSEYAETIGRRENAGLCLELCYDGSGCVRDGETDTTLFEFDDLRELLVLLLVNHMGMKNISKP